jgi:DNA-binding NarL/FixJ family response regulator
VDGLEWRQELQNMNELRATKIMFISSHSDELWKECSTKAGADGYIAKPIDVATLVQTIELVVRRGWSCDSNDLPDKEPWWMTKSCPGF